MNHRTSARLVMISAEILGAGSLVLFTLFVFAGPVVAVRLHFSAAGVLWWDALLSLVFFAQHSLMVRAWFNDWLARWVSRDFHPAIYAIASGVALALAMLFWQSSSALLLEVTGPARWLLRALALSAIAGFVWGISSLRGFDTFGREPIAARLRGVALPPPELTIRGPYRWVRHPLMFFMMVLIWTNPDVTADRALFILLWTLWLVIGSYLEERDLVAAFGERYREYQRVVPMLLPWRGPAGKSLAQKNRAVPAASS